MIRLTIGHTWDGKALPPEGHTELRLAWVDDRLHIDVDAPFAGDPTPAGVGSTPRLWEHEVVELFVFGEAGPYTEIELGPHGHWLVLRLDGVRHVADEGHPIAFRTSIRGARWTGTAEIDRRLLPDAPVRSNAFRIAGRGAGRRYDALVPIPGARPDFHQPTIGVRWPLECAVEGPGRF